MFKIKITLPDTITFTGLKALDLCRKLKLQDGVDIKISASTTPETKVDENFARKHFKSYTTSEETNTIKISDLSPEDLEQHPCQQYKNIYYLNSEMPKERIIALWLKNNKKVWKTKNILK